MKLEILMPQCFWWAREEIGDEGPHHLVVSIIDLLVVNPLSKSREERHSSLLILKFHDKDTLVSLHRDLMNNKIMTEK